MTDSGARSGGRILVDQLLLQGVDHVFCVPGESYLAVLDALYDTDIAVTVCRQEGGAAMMAEAYGKLTGRPGVCFVTRGPGATNASAGVHVARQDSTPMILFVGQVERGMREREAFQEVDYRAAFSPIAKWATEADATDRIPELVTRAFQTAASGRPGPVVMALPEDVLTGTAVAPDARPIRVPEPDPSSADLSATFALIEEARQPLVIAGGSRWTAEAADGLVRFAEAFELPVAVSFRRQGLFPATHPNFVGDLGVVASPTLTEYARAADLVLLIGGRLSEIASQGYSVMEIPVPAQRLVHVHPGTEELGRVYQPNIAINTSPASFLRSVAAAMPSRPPGRQDLLTRLRAAFEAWNSEIRPVPGAFNPGEAVRYLRETLPPSAVITNGAGNFATWVHRFYRFRQFGTQLAPTSGSMGYGLPAAVAAARVDRERPVICFAGDGDFLMTGQEFATAVQYDLPLIVVLVDNGMYGTIRMHQEREYPRRVSNTALRNPDFAAYARAFGGHGERVERTEEFPAAFERARASGRPAILHCLTDPEAITPSRSLSAIRAQAEAARAAASGR